VWTGGSSVATATVHQQSCASNRKYQELQQFNLNHQLSDSQPIEHDQLWHGIIIHLIYPHGNNGFAEPTVPHSVTTQEWN
jgi:hypothetical protein